MYNNYIQMYKTLLHSYTKWKNVIYNYVSVINKCIYKCICKHIKTDIALISSFHLCCWRVNNRRCRRVNSGINVLSVEKHLHNICRHKKKVWKSVPNLNVDITTSKMIYKKKVGEKQPHCNEIVHFSSNDFKDGKPKTLEILNKITELVNSELPPFFLLKRKLVWDLIMIFLLLL